MESLLSDPENRLIAALLDPYGGAALNYYTRYWTLAEQNELQLPIKSVIIYNRLIWLSVATIVFGLVYKFFSFSQNTLTFSFKKHKETRSVKKNFGGIVRIKLPKVTVDYSFWHNLKTTWRLSNIDFKYILKNWPFLSIVLVGLIIVLIALSEVGNLFGTETLPVTWKMLNSGGSFTVAINICTFLYAGMLVHRSKIAKMNELMDVTPIPNWSLFTSKFIALIKMQVVLLGVIMLSGILFQIYKGFYHFEIGHYLEELIGLRLINYVIWAFLALFIQTLFRNPYIGLFVLLVLSIGIPLLRFAGIEQAIFKYNDGPGFQYSDMDGYGSSLIPYFTYKLYWILAGLMLFILSAMFWVRGIPHSFKERLSIAKSRFKGIYVVSFVVLFAAFIGLGGRIYYENNILNERVSAKEREQRQVTWEKTYKKYQDKAQPRIVAVKADMNIFPKTLDFKASCDYLMVNKSGEVIDSILLNHNDYPSTFRFDKPVNLVSEDTVYNFNIYQLKSPLQPGDSLKLHVTVQNKPNSWLRKNSPVLENGTFINNFVLFPSLGYSSINELTDNKTREKYGLPPNDLKPEPTDSTALGNTYISKDSDWIDFEATVSTSPDQIAIAPGYLQKEWTENGRRYFHYKMDSKIMNFFAFNSARYEVKKDKWHDVDLEIYYHKGHEYNLERMFAGMKASLDYNSKNFSPYQHRQARIIEFPRTSGTFAQSFPNTIPYSEGIGFIAAVDDSEEGGVDYPFAVTVHEVAHQWWAHQVIGADVQGATMLSESMSEYVSLEVLKHQHGTNKMRKFLKRALDEYLTRRTLERKREKPLMYNDGQGYIRYQKGSLVFYALADYIGEDKLNHALHDYVEKVKFQYPPYTTTVDMMNYIREVTPDSLQYTLHDMFETITLYENRIKNVTSTKLDNGKYKVDIEFEVSKYRNDEKGKKFYSDNKTDSLSFKTEEMSKAIYSLPLADYVDIGIFATDKDKPAGDNEEVLYFKKHKITAIDNKVSIIVDKEPTEVGVDPYNKLIDTNSLDNRRQI
ncbi:M1 family aminopeptidase [Gaetbulibacter aestuarii]